MSAGPLRQAAAGVGLLAMAPIVFLLLTDALRPEEAALRALVVALVVVIVGNLARMVLTMVLRHVEDDTSDLRDAGRGQPGGGGGATPRRRAEDHAAATG